MTEERVFIWPEQRDSSLADAVDSSVVCERTSTRFIVWSNAPECPYTSSALQLVADALQAAGLRSLRDLRGILAGALPDHVPALESALSAANLGMLVRVWWRESAVDIWLREKQRLASNVNSLDLSVRASGCLAAAGILTIAQLVQYSREDLLDLPNMGRKSIIEIEERLAKLGLSIRSHQSPKRSTVPSSVIPTGLELNVESLNLSVRPRNCLSSAGIHTVAELAQLEEHDLLNLKNMGRNSVAEIGEKLRNIGLSLGMKRGSSLSTICLAVFASFEQCGIDEETIRKLARVGIHRMDQLVRCARSWIGSHAQMSPSSVADLHEHLNILGLSLEMELPLWMKEHRSEVVEGFQREIEQLATHRTTKPPTESELILTAPSPEYIEEEFEAFFVTRASEHKKAIIRHRFGWDGGSGATLDEVGREFTLTRERVRQIEATALRHVKEEHAPLLRRAVDYIAQRVPAFAEEVEAGLLEMGLVRRPLRLEAIAATADRIAMDVPWLVRRVSEKRLVLTEASLQDRQRLFSEASSRVSHYGVTRKEYVLGETGCVIATELLDFYFSTFEGLEWLDEERDWLWLPTKRNSLISRLAKIVRIAPRLAIDDVRTAVLRDRRMASVDLPPHIFRSLCSVLPGCRVEGDDLIAVASMLDEDQEDSTETQLVDILRRHGPVMSRRDLDKYARSAGIGEVSFSSVLSDSNVIVKHGPELYGLVGSHISSLPVDEPVLTAEPEVSHDEAMPMSVVQSALSGVLDACDPGADSFLAEVLLSVSMKSANLRKQGAWSVMELRLSQKDRHKLRNWAQTGDIDLKQLSKRRLRFDGMQMDGLEALAITFLLSCAEIARESATEGEMWPFVQAALGERLRSKLFLVQGVPRPIMRQATERICSKLGVRHLFGRQGEQSWLRTVFLQFGMTLNGWQRLSSWLSPGSALPVAVEDLLNSSSMRSDSFAEFWQTLQRFRWEQSSRAAARSALNLNPWVYAEEIDRLLSAVAEPPTIHGEVDVARGIDFEEPDRLLETPLLSWAEEAPQFTLRVRKRSRWLTEPRYVLVADNGKRAPVVRNGDEYELDVPNGTLRFDLTRTSVKVDLHLNQKTCLPDLISVRLAPTEFDFALYDLNTGEMLTYGDPKLRGNRSYALLCRSTIVVRPDSQETRRVFGGDWTIRAYRDGLPAMLEIEKEGAVLWGMGPDLSEAVLEAGRKRFTVICRGGQWGEPSRFTVQALPEIEPKYLLMDGGRIPLEAVTNTGFLATLPLAPNVDYGSIPVRVECLWKGRLRLIGADVKMGSVFGIAVETEDGWRVLNDKAEIDAEYLRRRRIITRVPPTFDGENVPLDYWAWMEGDHLCDRPGKTAAVIGSGLHGVGESLVLSVGPYNRSGQGERVAKSVIRSGDVERIEHNGDECQIQLRFSSCELGPEHAIWVWYEGAQQPEVVDRSGWRQEGDICDVKLGGDKKPVALCVSFQGSWLGARTCQAGWVGFARLILSSPNWSNTAKWLKWWRVPLMHPELKSVARGRVELAPLATLQAWTSDDGPSPTARFSEANEDAWRSVTRSFLWKWKPTIEESLTILTELGFLADDSAQDIDPPWERCQALLFAHPLLFVQAVMRGTAALFKNQPRNNVREFVARVRNRLLDVDSDVSASAVKVVLRDALAKAAEAMGVDSRFVEKILLPNAVAFLLSTLDNDHNLRISIANSQAARQYLAAVVLDKVVQGELS
jgi:hypothetical protein